MTDTNTNVTANENSTNDTTDNVDSEQESLKQECYPYHSRTQRSDFFDGEAERTPPRINFSTVIQNTLQREESDNSHRELHPDVFHPSSIGYSPWKIVVSKLGVEDVTDALGTFEVGNMLHEYVQAALLSHATDMTHREARTFIEQNNGQITSSRVFPSGVDGVRIEQPVEFTDGGVTFTGHADVFDPNTGIVYDIKSRSGWYNFEPPYSRHVDQLHCYMKALDAEYGQVVYVSKKDLEVRTWPADEPFSFDEERWNGLVEKCQRVRDALYEHGIPRGEDEIPFEKPDNWVVDHTTLDFSSFTNGES